MENNLSAVSELYKNSFAIYKKEFWKLIGISLVPILGIFPLFAIYLIYYYFGSSLDHGFLYAVKILILILGILGVFLAIYAAILADIGMKIFLRDKNGIGQSLRNGRKIFWKYVALEILKIVFILLWSLLLIIPGLIFLVFYSFAEFVLIFENYAPRAALKRSKELVKGNWWAIAWRLVLFIIIFYLLFLILSLPASFFAADSGPYQFWQFIIKIIRFLVGPFFTVYMFLIFKDLLDIKKKT